MAPVEKILIAGPAKPWSHETICARIFRSMGLEVRHFDNIDASVLSARGRWIRHAQSAEVSLRFVRACKSFRPDVIYLPKADNLHHRAVREAKENTGARLVVWYPDHPFKADQTSWNVIRNLERCDLFLIWGKYLLDPLRSAGCPRVEYLPFGFDPETFALDAEPTEAELAPFRSDLCFVGTWDRDRERVLSDLAHLDLAIWGPKWPEQIAEDSPLASKVRGGGLFRRDMVKAFKAASICFNHLREHNGPAHNVRCMETTGIGGGVMLVRRTPEVGRQLFTEDEHVFCFDPNESLAIRAGKLLEQKASFADISKSARDHVLKNHLLRDRLKTLLDMLDHD